MTVKEAIEIIKYSCYECDRLRCNDCPLYEREKLCGDLTMEAVLTLDAWMKSLPEERLSDITLSVLL